MTFSPTLIYSLFWLGMMLLNMAFWNALYGYKLTVRFTLSCTFLGVVLVVFSLGQQLGYQFDLGQQLGQQLR